MEGEVGYFRRNHWVPVPMANDLSALNRKLHQDCRADESRIISGRTDTVGTRLLAEKQHLLPLAAEVFDLAEVSFPHVDQTGCAKVRTQGRWPASYDRLWDQLTERHGRQAGTRAMVTLIRMGQEFGYEKLAIAVERALALGCGDVAAVRHLLMSDQLQHSVGEAVDIGALCVYERPLPTMLEYDQLFSGMSVQAVQA